MAQKHGSFTLTELASRLGADILGSGSGLITRPVPAGSSDPEGITFAVSPRHLRLALGGEIGAVIVKKGTGPQAAPTLEADDPRAAFMGVLALFDRPAELEEGIHPTAVVAPTAVIGEGARIGPFAAVGADAEIGAGCRIFSHCHIGAGAFVGENTVLHPRVTLYPEVVIGARCIIHSGAVIGADGFGFVFDGARQVKVPQVGRVTVGDDVEIGANTCIDRATCGDTVIAGGVKLDDLVMVGHNTRIGSHTVIASLTGISGSSTIGERCVMGGQAGIGDHAVLADDVHLGGQTGVSGRVESGAYMGTPAMPVTHGLRAYSIIRKLPELAERVKALEEELEALRRGS